jgi:Fur family ferric uptake transcriptional regulator
MKIKQALKLHGLRETAFRRLLLQVFNQRTTALNLEDIRGALPPESDRITIYRTLQLFEKQGLIHSIADSNGHVKYALCPEDCNAEGHHDHHAHFTCVACESTWCITQFKAPEIVDAHIAKIMHTELLVHGKCVSCAA